MLELENELWGLEKRRKKEIREGGGVRVEGTKEEIREKSGEMEREKIYIYFFQNKSKYEVE